VTDTTLAISLGSTVGREEMFAENLNICLLSLEWPPHGCGIGTYMFNLARGLVDRGHRVTVLTHDREVEQLDGVSIVPVSTLHRSQGLWRRVQKWRMEPFHTWAGNAHKAFTTLREQTDFDVLETAEYGAWGRHLIGDKSVPVVVRCHCPTRILWSAVHEDEIMPLGTRIQDLRERSQARSANGLVSPSAALARRLSGCWKIPLDGFRVIPNPIDDTQFRPANTRGGEDGEILYVGRLDGMKGVFDLARALGPLLTRHPHVSVRLVGMDREAPRELRKYGKSSSEVIRSLLPRDVRDRLYFQGHMSVSQIVRFWQKAMCAVVPTRSFENFPYTVLEAMSCGCPVVATTCGGPEEIITDGVDGLLVPAGDTHRLGAAIEALALDSALRERLGKRARQTVEAEFALSAVVPRIVSFYQEVIRNHRSRRRRELT